MMQEHRTLLNEQQKEIQFLRNQIREQALETTGLASHESLDNQTQQIYELQKEVHDKLRMNYQGTTSSGNEFVELKHKVKDIQDKLHELPQGNNTQPTTPQRSRYFPNVDPTSIQRPRIPIRSPTQQEDDTPDHVPSMPENATKTNWQDAVLPFGAKVMICLKGESHECWIQKCY